MPNITKTLHVADRKQWRRWLEKNHTTKKEIWLVFYKKPSGKPCVPYDHTVEEALCFGCIDSILKRIDDDRYAVRFTPRRNDSIWSDSNKKRVGKMIREGKMTAAGLLKVRQAKKGGRWQEALPYKTVPPMPADMKRALRTDAKALENFNRFPPSHRKHYIWWVLDAKRLETRKRRIAKIVGRARRNKKLGMS